MKRLITGIVVTIIVSFTVACGPKNCDDQAMAPVVIAPAPSCQEK